MGGDAAHLLHLSISVCVCVCVCVGNGTLSLFFLLEGLAPDGIPLLQQHEEGGEGGCSPALSSPMSDLPSRPE